MFEMCMFRKMVSAVLRYTLHIMDYSDLKSKSVIKEHSGLSETYPSSQAYM